MITPHDPAQPGSSSDGTPVNDALLDQALRDTTQAYIADDGFTARVTVGLPPRRALTIPRRTLLLLAAGVAGGAIAFVAGGRDLAKLAQEALDGWIYWSFQPLPGLGLPLSAVATLVFCFTTLAFVAHRLRVIPAVLKR